MLKNPKPKTKNKLHTTINRLINEEGLSYKAAVSKAHKECRTKYNKVYIVTKVANNRNYSFYFKILSFTDYEDAFKQYNYYIDKYVDSVAHKSLLEINEQVFEQDSIKKEWSNNLYIKRETRIVYDKSYHVTVNIFLIKVPRKQKTIQYAYRTELKSDKIYCTLDDVFLTEIECQNYLNNNVYLINKIGTNVEFLEYNSYLVETINNSTSHKVRYDIREIEIE